MIKASALNKGITNQLMSYGGRQPDLISNPHDDLYSFVINKRVQFIIVQKKLKKGGGETDRNFP